MPPVKLDFVTNAMDEVHQMVDCFVNDNETFFKKY